MPKRNDSSSAALRVAIGDERDLVRAGLRVVLESVPNWRVAGEAASGAAIVEIVRRLTPDVALVSLELPEMGDLGLIERIRETSPRTSTVVVAPRKDDDLAEQTRCAGACGFITEESSSAEVIVEIRSAVLRAACGRVDPFPIRAATHLTGREVEIVGLIAAGCSTDVAARTLGITRKTVERHRYNIMRKLELNSVVEVVHFAVRENIIAP